MRSDGSPCMQRCRRAACCCLRRWLYMTFVTVLAFVAAGGASSSLWNQDGFGTSANVTRFFPIGKAALLIDTNISLGELPETIPCQLNVSLAFAGGAWDGAYVWLAPFASTCIVRIDPSTRQITTSSSWPGDMIVTSQNFIGAVFDGERLWLVPFGTTSLVAVTNLTNGSIVVQGYNSWPTGALAVSNTNFVGGVHDPMGFVWLAPFSATGLVRVNVTDGSMQLFDTTSFCAIGACFSGMVNSGNGYVWLVPLGSSVVLRVDVALLNANVSALTEGITAFAGWPVGLRRGAYAFSGGTFDGNDRIWFAPFSADRLVTISVTTGVIDSVGSNLTWPEGLVRRSEAFNGACFDGVHVYFVPRKANRVVRVHTLTNVAESIPHWPTGFTSLPLYPYYGCVATGLGELWLLPSSMPVVIAIGNMSTTLSVSQGSVSPSSTISVSLSAFSSTTSSTRTTPTVVTTTTTDSGIISRSLSLSSRTTSPSDSQSLIDSVSESPTVSWSGSDTRIPRTATTAEPTVSQSRTGLLSQRCDIASDCSVAAWNSSVAPLAMPAAVVVLQPGASPWQSATIVPSTGWWSGTSAGAVAACLSCSLSCSGASISVMNATVRISTPGAGSWITANVTQTVSSSQRSVWIVLSPPSGETFFDSGSLGVVAWYSSQRLTLRLVFRWADTIAAQHDVTVPIATLPTPVVSAVATQVQAVSQWLSMAGTTTTAVTVGRVTATRQLMLCSADGGASGGLLGWSLSDASDTSPMASEARGAIAGNALVLLGCSAFVVVVALIAAGLAAYSGSGLSTLTLQAFLRAVVRIAFPSCVLIVWSTVLPTTAAGTVLIASYHSNSPAAHDWYGAGWVILGGIGMCVLPLLLLALVPLYAATKRWGLKLQRIAKETKTSRESSTVPQCVSRGWLAWSALMSRQWEWQQAKVAPRTSSEFDPPGEPHRVAQAILLEYRVLWYPLVDFGSLAMSSALAALSGQWAIQECQGLATAAVVTVVVQLVVCLRLRPFTSPFSHAYAVVMMFLTALSAALQLSYVLQATSSSNSDGSQLGSVPWQVTASAICGTMVSGSGIVKTIVVDIPGTLKAVARYVRSAFAAPLRKTLQQQSNWHHSSKMLQLEIVEDSMPNVNGPGDARYDAGVADENDDDPDL